MGCVQAKAAAPQTAMQLSTTRVGISAIAQGISKGATSAATAVSNGATGAVTAVGHGAASAAKVMGDGARHVGSGAAGAVHKVGHGAVGAIKRVGHGLVESKGASSESHIEPQIEKTWYEQVYESLSSLDPFACCCQPAGESNLLGSLVTRILASFDTSTLGVKVEMGSLVVDPAFGRIAIEGLTVFNPEGYHSEYLLHADQVVIDIDMQQLLFSLGKELHVEELVFDGVDVIYEKGLFSSNLNDLLEKIDSGSDEAPQQTQDSDMKVVLHTILAENVGAKLATKFTLGTGLRLEVGSLKYDDFDAEMGVGRGLMDIVRILFSTLLKSVLATVVGKENLLAIKDGLRSAGSASVERVKTGCVSLKGSRSTCTLSPRSGTSQNTVETVRTSCTTRTGCFSRQSSKGVSSPISLETGSSHDEVQ
eukprot:TRINITY_DN1881_c0_g1_i8.p1 TRINITY_DN1881_c0_g1~~TRINITY_DN1881_c0_g1_i8.p1  ORF type:complete len:422 (+),score=75.73 TRINITY_DN1881_c0_g1_i8:74-1339(+)